MRSRALIWLNQVSFGAKTKRRGARFTGCDRQRRTTPHSGPWQKTPGGGHRGFRRAIASGGNSRAPCSTKQPAISAVPDFIIFTRSGDLIGVASHWMSCGGRLQGRRISGGALTEADALLTVGARIKRVWRLPVVQTSVCRAASGFLVHTRRRLSLPDRRLLATRHPRVPLSRMERSPARTQPGNSPNWQ
jgi:hypothetical protein